MPWSSPQTQLLMRTLDKKTRAPNRAPNTTLKLFVVCPAPPSSPLDRRAIGFPLTVGKQANGDSANRCAIFRE